MGNLCGMCGVFRPRPVRRKIVILLVGLDNSGKTTAAKGLSGDFIDSTVPTVGFSVVKLTHKGFEVLIYDLGGGPQIRAIWNSYFHDVHGLMFVVDASDRARLEESKDILERLLHDEKLAGKPVLVLANKQDKTNALDEIDIVEMLKLEPLVNQQKCPTLVEVCTALTNPSPNNNGSILDRRLVRGFRWLVKQIISNYAELNARVEADMKAEAERVASLREKLKQQREEEKENMNSLTPREAPVSPISKNTDVVSMSNLANGEPPAISLSESGADLLLGVSQQKTDLRTILEKKGELQQKLAMANRNWKNNKVHPGGDEMLDQNMRPVIIPVTNGPLFEFGSMTVRALTSPGRNNINNPKISAFQLSDLRPTTSKSLKNEAGAWGLEQELKIVLSHNQRRFVQQDETDFVEYFPK